MNGENLHVTDEQLLLHLSGELSGNLLKVQSHLEVCAKCRARLEELESALATYSSAHRSAWDSGLSPASEPRALLKARLAEAFARENSKRGPRSGWSALLDQRHFAVGALIAACLLLAIRLHRLANSPQSMSASLSYREEPDLRLTPGATVPVTQNEVCSEAPVGSSAMIPISLKRKVFQLYGVTPAQPDAYEVDYLITPELGGATDIRNLWPEPYQDTVWNAHVKDQLEDRLHQMVCRGDVDLATAQHDISTDWIAAYRKYFHSARPVADNSSFDSSGLSRSLPVT